MTYNSNQLGRWNPGESWSVGGGFYKGDEFRSYMNGGPLTTLQNNLTGVQAPLTAGL